MKRACLVGLVCIWVLQFHMVSPAVAQPPDQQIIDLNAEAMDAYNNLDVERASSVLEKALGIAMQYGVTGDLLVATYLNLGVVSVGGIGDKQKGLDYFMQACCLNPATQLDPLVSTPDIQGVFQQAQQMANSGGCTAAGIPQAAPPPPQPAAPVQPVVPVQPLAPVSQAVPMQPQPVPGGQIFHQPPPPQVSQAPLPIYAEVPTMQGVEKVYLHYLGLGMNTYRKVQMLPFGGGYAFQVSCRDVWEPRVRYYITAVDDDDRVLATSGTAQAPYEVQVVTTLQGPGPALPGSQSPGPCVEVECPPGISGDECEKPLFHQIGEGCDTDRDCQPGLICEEDTCIIPGANTDNVDFPDIEVDEGPGEFARGFFQLGFTLGFASIGAGMITDRAPPENLPPETPLFYGPDTQPQPEYGIVPGAFNQDLAWVPDADSYDMQFAYDDEGNILIDEEGRPLYDPQPISNTTDECPADGTVTGDPDGEGGMAFGEFPSRFCARVKTPGFVTLPALRVAVGYFVLPRLSLAGVFRFQFEAGEGQLANMLLGGRLEYLFFGGEVARGLGISGFLGGTAGQIQVKPPPQGTDNSLSPFVISGIGGAHVGSNVRYRFHKNFGIVFSPELDVQFPAILINIDLTLGAEAAF